MLWQMPATTVDTPLARGSLPGEPTLMIAGIVTTNVNDCVTVYSQFDDILSSSQCMPHTTQWPEELDGTMLSVIRQAGAVALPLRESPGFVAVDLSYAW